MDVIKTFVYGKKSKKKCVEKRDLYLKKKKRHRHPASHVCKALIEDEQRKMKRKIEAQEKLAKTFSITTEPKKTKLKTVLPVKTKHGGMVELMKMKSQAKGSSSVPVTSRMYLYVQCPKGSSLESQSVYFDKVKKKHTFTYSSLKK